MSNAIDAEIAQRVRQEFLDEALDVVNEIEVTLGNLRSKSIETNAALAIMRRRLLGLRVGARSVNLPAVELVVHRLDDYLADLTSFRPEQIEDVQAFADRLRGALDGEPGTDLAQLARQLPARKTFDVADVTISNIEVMLINPQRTTARLVERELQACGYRVANVAKSFEAIELAVRTRPDLIICAAVLDELSGIDLACAFSAMPTTARIPFALLTSFGWGHPSLEGLPQRAAIIRKGQQFGDDLAEALARFQIT